MAAAPVSSEDTIRADVSCCMCLVVCNGARVHPTGDTVREDCPHHHGGVEGVPTFRAQAPIPIQTQPAVFQPTDTPVPGLGHVTAQPSAPFQEAPAFKDAEARGTGHHHGNQEQVVQSLPSAPIPARPASNDDAANDIGHPHGNQEQEDYNPQNTPILGSGNEESYADNEDSYQQGTFNNVTGMAVSEEGEIFVADKERIQVFNLQGTFVREFPTVVSESDEETIELLDVALDMVGNLWVLKEKTIDNEGTWDIQYVHYAVQYNKQGRVLRKFDLKDTGCYRGVAVDTRRNLILVTRVGNNDDQGFEDFGHEDNNEERERKAKSEVLVFRPDGTLVKTIKMGQQLTMEYTDTDTGYITVDGEGNILVSDNDKHCVYVYNEDGQFLFQFGGRGSGEGRLNNPRGICTDIAGNIIVADWGNGRVEMFDKTGRFLKHITKDLELSGAVAMATQGQLVVTYEIDDKHTFGNRHAFCVLTPELDKVLSHSIPTTLVAKVTSHHKIKRKAGRITFAGKGRRQGKLYSPSGIAVSEEGEIFVADRWRIQVFTLQGTFVRQFPTVMSGEQEMYPHDVAMDGEGNLWVVGDKDSANFAVQYNKQGRVLRKFDLQKTEWNRGVAVDTRRNHILITQTTGDWGNPHGEVLVFRPDGTLVRTVGQQQGSCLEFIDVDGEGNIFLLGFDQCNCVLVYSEDGQLLLKVGDGENDEVQREDEDQDEDQDEEHQEIDKRKADDEGKLDEPKASCTDRAGNIIVADEGHEYGRVDVWDKTGKFLYRIFEDRNDRFCPEAVAMAPQGQLVVVDHHNKITVFDKEMVRGIQPGRVIFGKKGRQPGQFTDPRGVAVSEEEEVFVADNENKRIKVFTMQGMFVRQFPTVVMDGGKMDPNGVALDGEGNLWVAGKVWWTGYDFAVQYDKRGRVLRTFELKKTEWNRGVAVDTRRNHILITKTTGYWDNWHGEVLVFRPDGTFVRTVGQQQGMEFPGYITVDGEGNILVSDNENHCVYVYKQDGQFLFQFGGRGSDEGQLKHPCGICTDRAGNIIVADCGNKRVEMFDKTGRFLKHITTDMRVPCAVAMAPQGQLVVTDCLRPKVIVLETY